MKKIILTFFKIFIFLYGGVLAWFFFQQDQFIFYPDTASFDDCNSFTQSEKVKFNSMRAYWTERATQTIVVFYHGNAGRACDRIFWDQIFAQENIASLFVEYSGYAELNKSPSLALLLQNVQDTIAFLQTQNYQNVIVVGESLGSGLAAYHASKTEVAKVILITPYTSLADVAEFHYPFLPARFLLRTNITTVDFLAHFHKKIAVFVVANDQVIPEKFGLALFQHLSSPFKKFYKIEHAGHSDISTQAQFITVFKKELVD